MANRRNRSRFGLLVVSEDERNRLAAEANDRFLRTGIAIQDVYGTLEH